MCLLQRQLLVQLKMLFDVQVAMQILNAYVVYVHIVAGCDGTDASKNIFRRSRTRTGVDRAMGTAPDQNPTDSKRNHSPGPDVSSKMKPLCLQRLAIVFGGNSSQRTRAPEVDSHRKK